MIFVFEFEKCSLSEDKKNQNRLNKVRVFEDTPFGGKQKESGG